MAGSVGQPTFGFFPWVAVKASTGTWSRSQASNDFGMGGWLSTVQSSTSTWEHYFDSVTYKWAQVGARNVDYAIGTCKIGGTTVGTLDWYNGSSDRIYQEITGISISSAGVKEVELSNPTKNASSSGYNLLASSLAFIKTSGTSSTPSGTDTPGYTWELPGVWMGNKSTVGMGGRSQQSGNFAGGAGGSLGAGSLNDEVVWDIWQDTGTFKYAQIIWTANDQGIYHIQLDGVDKATIDAYSASTVQNVYKEVTGIAIATAAVKTFRLKMASKNASSASHGSIINSTKWIRTGA